MRGDKSAHDGNRYLNNGLTLGFVSKKQANTLLDIAILYSNKIGIQNDLCLDFKDIRELR